MKEPQAAAEEEGRSLPSPEEGDVFASRYRIEKLLGKGLYGQVYLVKHIKYGRPTILKVFYPGLFGTEESKQDFKSEFDSIKKLKHPGVPPHLEQGDWAEAGSKYCAMDYVNGSSLRSLMNELKKKGKQLAPGDAVQIITKLLETLRAIHPHGVTHRNIKPENVLILAKGKVASKIQWDLRLSDFALARAPVDWMTEVAPEKLPYMSPELLGYGGEVGPRTDIYAAGALLYEMLTGVPPDPNLTPPSSIRNYLPRKFDDIVDLCLAHNQEDRYSSVEDLLFDLGQLPANIPFEENAEPRKWWAPLLAIAGLVGLGGVIGVILWAGDTNPTGPDYWKVLRERARQDKDFITESQEEIARKRDKEPDMVYIPGGSFIRGYLPGEEYVGEAESKWQLVKVYGYYIDRYEFPNRRGENPVTMISFADAQRECNKLGKRLCTTEEWERACKGADSLIYGYGDTYDPQKCSSVGPSGIPKAGSSPGCTSDYSVYDLAGSVPEWAVYRSEGEPDRTAFKGGLVGESEIKGTRCAAINFETSTYENPNIGFRCCK